MKSPQSQAAQPAECGAVEAAGLRRDGRGTLSGCVQLHTCSLHVESPVGVPECQFHLLLLYILYAQGYLSPQGCKLFKENYPYISMYCIEE